MPFELVQGLPLWYFDVQVVDALAFIICDGRCITNQEFRCKMCNSSRNRHCIIQSEMARHQVAERKSLNPLLQFCKLLLLIAGADTFFGDDATCVDDVIQHLFR